MQTHDGHTTRGTPMGCLTSAEEPQWCFRTTLVLPALPGTISTELGMPAGFTVMRGYNGSASYRGGFGGWYPGGYRARWLSRNRSIREEKQNSPNFCCSSAAEWAATATRGLLATRLATGTAAALLHHQERGTWLRMQDVSDIPIFLSGQVTLTVSD